MNNPKSQNEEARKYANDHRIETVRYAIHDVGRLQDWAKKDPERFPTAVELGKRLEGFELEGRRYVCQNDDFNPPELVKLVAEALYPEDESVFLVSGTWQQPSGQYEKNQEGAKPVFDQNGRIWIPDEDPFEWIIEALNEAAVSADGLTALAEVVPIDPETSRPDPILAAPLVMVHRDHQQANLFSPSRWGETQNGQYEMFSGFGRSQEDGPIVPALPMALYDLGVGGHQHISPGSGAPMALRIFVEMCLSVPLAERNRPGPVVLKPQRFCEFLETLYPDSSSYRPGRHYGPIREALESLTTPQARVPWVDPETGDGAARFVVVPLDVPREGRMKDWIQFQVHLPPGSHRGAIVDRPAMRVAGVRSVTMYRMALSLALHWHDPGRLRVPISRGKEKHWYQVRSPERYPEVTDAQLIGMAYPRTSDDDNRRMRLKRAQEALDALVEIGYAAVHPRRLIYPGPKWVGWGT